MAWVTIAGITPDDHYTATVYIVTPDGSSIPFPKGTGEVAPLDARYVTNNHHGRLPGSFMFSDQEKPGTYRLTATLTPEGSSQLISFSSVPVYFSTLPSVSLYQNRADLSEGMQLRITAAVTRGEEPMNASLTVLLEPPEGSPLYLPAGTEQYASTRMKPLTSDYMLLLDDSITHTWQNGTYTIRARLTSDDGIPLAEDIITFSISRDNGTLQLVFPRDVRTKIVTGSRIRLTDTSTREIVLERRIEGPETDGTLDVPAGTYLISGECTTADGGLWIIPAGSANRVVIHAGKTTTTDLSLLPQVGGMYADVNA